MSIPREPKPAKLIIGLFMKDRSLFDGLVAELGSAFGSLDMVSPWMPFDYTSYYEQEMGAPLFRRLLAFKTLIEQLDLASVKLTTNHLEDQYSRNGRRRVNIDPGYLSSTKSDNFNSKGSIIGAPSEIIISFVSPSRICIIPS